MRHSVRSGVIGMVVVALATVAGAVLMARQALPPRPGAAQNLSTLPAKALPPNSPLPPLNMAGYALARPAGLTKTVYEFVARHPEVSRYVPCYCGCEADGHKANESCFVAARDASGNVTQWDTHGFGCAICLDVGRESMQLFNSGADPAAIRAAIEKKWTPTHSTHTPTPPVPAKKR